MVAPDRKDFPKAPSNSWVSELFGTSREQKMSTAVKLEKHIGLFIGCLEYRTRKVRAPGAFKDSRLCTFEKFVSVSFFFWVFFLFFGSLVMITIGKFENLKIGKFVCL